MREGVRKSCTCTHPVELPSPVRQAVAMTSHHPGIYCNPKIGSMVPMKAMGVALSIRPAGDTKEDRAACGWGRARVWTWLELLR